MDISELLNPKSYAEKFYNGHWWYRHYEYGPWYKFSYEMLENKILKMLDIMNVFKDDLK